MYCSGGSERSSLVLLVAILALPGTLVKQMINIAQALASCTALIILDRQRDAQVKES